MTTRQFRRMQVFALRMARYATPYRYRRRCTHWVGEYLAAMACENFGIHYRHVINWDDSETWTREEMEAEPWKRWTMYKSDLLCDFTSAHNGLAEYEPELSREREAPNGGYETVLLNLVKCCLRAACDVAASPSAGVLGWTVGDLRRMWKGRRIPDWVTADFEPAIATANDATPVWL
ncbi:hypothetical protein [Luteolibacter marinus]|uniref:hypothetical protein n=1 Tax=Luteolibacter marinus TaxID=2776705 RepID=UPI0018686380|nr:hypothetical protein [Luteolibacter marinus]